MDIISNSLIRMIMNDQVLSKSATIRINQPLPLSFNLFTPEGEKRWVPGWEPEIIRYNNEGIKKGTTFITPGKSGFEDEYVWYVCELDLTTFYVKYMVTTQNRVWFVEVNCKASPMETTHVKVKYTYQALNEKGYNLNKLAISDMYAQDLNDWERAINFYLENGSKIGE